ncbi:MAG: alpha/beta hydrolase [Gemmatimonadota bacterium]
MQILLIAAAAFLGLLVALRLALPKLVPLFVFHPEPLRPRESHPRYWGYPEAREVRFPTSDNLSLHGWWFPAAGPSERRGTAIFFHGNAGHIGPRGEIGAGLSRLGFDVLLPDYRGYGLSEGKPSELGLYRDAEAAYVYALRRSGGSAETLLVVGNSLGSAVAAELAARRPVGGVG